MYIHSKGSAAGKPNAQLQGCAQFAGFTLCRLGFSLVAKHIPRAIKFMKSRQFVSLHIVGEANQFPRLTFSLSVFTW